MLTLEQINHRARIVFWSVAVAVLAGGVVGCAVTRPAAAVDGPAAASPTASAASHKLSVIEEEAKGTGLPECVNDDSTDVVCFGIGYKSDTDHSSVVYILTPDGNIYRPTLDVWSDDK